MLNKVLFLSFLCFFSLAFSLENLEEMASSKNETDIPIEINCDSGITCERSKNICTANGNVVVTHKEYTLKCDTLITYFRQTDRSKNELYKIDAIGKAVMQSQDKIIEAQSFKADIYKNEEGKYLVRDVEAFNDVLVITPKEVAKAKYGHYQPDKRMMILKNDVRITNQEGQMEGAYAEVDLDKGISKMLMKSPVHNRGEREKSSPSRVKVLILPKAQK